MEGNILKCDPIGYDVKLANDFFQKNSFEYDSIQHYIKEETKVVEGAFGNKIHVLSEEQLNYIKEKVYKNALRKESKRTFETWKILSKKIKSNAKLFASLEFTIRNISAEETINVNLQLMLQNLEYNQIRNSEDKIYGCPLLIFDDVTPLAVLGLATCEFENNITPAIIATPKTAPVATLFVQLCQEVGFQVELLIVEDNIGFLQKNKKTGVKNALSRGCLAVITETADIDSAVDIILASFLKNPWRINRILVQENIYNSVNKTLEWKSKGSKIKIPNVTEQFKNKSAATFQVDNKTFLIDYAGEEPEQLEEIILVEGFRTVPELQSLLKAYNGFCLSLWCNDITIANQLAYSASAPITWINDYGNFEGHCRQSQAFYTNLTTQKEDSITFHSGDVFPSDQKKKLSPPPYAGHKDVSLENNGLSVVMSFPSDLIFVVYQGPDDIAVAAKGLSLAAFYKKHIILVNNYCEDQSLNDIIGNFDLTNTTICITEKQLLTVNKSYSWYKTKSVWTKFKHI